jgi:hypothetical protein
MNPFVLSTTESNVQMRAVKMRSTDVKITIFANTFNNSLAINLRVNGATVGNTITFTTGETGSKTISYTSEIQDGDLIDLLFTVSATSGAVSFAPGVIHYD